MLHFVTESSRPDSAQIEVVRFRDPLRARRTLGELQSRLMEVTIQALPSLLIDIPDADQALMLLERLVSTSDDRLAKLLDGDHSLLHRILLLCGHSYWLGEALVQNVDLIPGLQRDRDLQRTLEREDFLESYARVRARSSEAEASLLLARFKKRALVRIALRDILGVATLAESTSELSALADVLIGEAVNCVSSQVRARHGSPLLVDARGRQVEARFAVLSLGKLGGSELNYSSDVDLLYLYDGGEAAGELTLREHFVRQAQLVTELLSRATPEGPVFRIDLRLRPQGHEGEAAVALDQAVRYYTHAAQDWELQALIKARHCAGDAELAREFLSAVQSRIYVATINFAAIETAANSRRKIGEHRRRSQSQLRETPTIDVKLDRGGIRDIEFLVQCLQRVYGGEEPWLRSCGTLFSLQKLNDKGHLSSADFRELSVAYEFLRIVEHRLQLQRGQQLHRLPSSAEEMEILARAVEHHGAVGAGALLRSVRERMGLVAAIYERIIHQQKQREQGSAVSGADSYYIGAREFSFEQLLQRIKADSPDLYHTISPANLSSHGRRNLHRFLGAAVANAESYAGLVAKPAAAGLAIPLLDTSDLLADSLVRNPFWVQMLSDPTPEGHSGESKVAALLLPFVGLDRDRHESLALLRRRYARAAFAIAAKDLLAPRSAFASLKESTHLADEAIRGALHIVNAEHSLAVFALGRLGTEEFDIASDADLLFIRAPEADEEEARQDAERVVSALSAYTRDGVLFAVDARLRPHGGEGELVATAGQLEHYLRGEAKPWEALTYSKIRFVAGRKDVAALLLPLVWHQIVEMGCRPDFTAAAGDMRTKLEKSNRYENSFKLARGGFYDIDFLTSYLMLRQAKPVSGNTLERLERLHAEGVLKDDMFAPLCRATILYRTVDHAIRLVTGRARPELPTAGHAREATRRLVNEILSRQASDDLQSELQQTQEHVRSIFLQVIA